MSLENCSGSVSSTGLGLQLDKLTTCISRPVTSFISNKTATCTCINTCNSLMNLVHIHWQSTVWIYQDCLMFFKRVSNPHQGCIHWMKNDLLINYNKHHISKFPLNIYLSQPFTISHSSMCLGIKSMLVPCFLIVCTEMFFPNYHQVISISRGFLG